MINKKEKKNDGKQRIVKQTDQNSPEKFDQTKFQRNRTKKNTQKTKTFGIEKKVIGGK